MYLHLAVNNIRPLIISVDVDPSGRLAIVTTPS
jgi:hypothetical protein